MPIQLQFPKYILENRTPTLRELCDHLPSKSVQARVRHRNPARKKKRYPRNWEEVSHIYKRRVNYCCQVCGKKCLRPDDSKDGLTRSEIARLTLNSHHIDGDVFNDSPDNIFVVCSTHHLEIHRGTGGVPPKGQQVLFKYIKRKN